MRSSRRSVSECAAFEQRHWFAENGCDTMARHARVVRIRGGLGDPEISRRFATECFAGVRGGTCAVFAGVLAAFAARGDDESANRVPGLARCAATDGDSRHGAATWVDGG